MGDMHTGKKAGDEAVITFTVAECGEFHSLGEYHDGIGTLEEAAAIYRKIRPERMNGIPSIGIKVHEAGTAGDIQLDLLTGIGIDIGTAGYVLEPHIYKKALEIAERMAVMFPDKEIFTV